MFEHHSVYLSSLSLSFWAAVLILRQMKSNKLYTYLKLFQREAYFCSLTRFQRHPQAGNEYRCWWYQGLWEALLLPALDLLLQ